ncbi:DUF177 domain-containing protein [bacterium]|nr:DUF177 domain-containing protein [bacterium]
MNNTNKISIDDIENATGKLLEVDFDDIIDNIPSSKNVKAHLIIKSLGDFIEVKGSVRAELTLECDLCLKEFEYNLEEEINETYAKNSLMEEYGQETEIKDGQFVTDLEGSDEIDIYDLLYQSVILNIPNKKVCGINCNKGVFQTDEEFVEEDPRMEVFKNIKLDK